MPSSIIVPNAGNISVSHQTNLGVASYDVDDLYSPDTGFWKSQVLRLVSPKYEPIPGYVWDASRYHHPGTIAAATWDRLPSGARYLKFNGSSAKVAIGNVGNIKTIKYWIKLNAANQFVLDLDGGTNRVNHNGVLVSTISATHYLDGAPVTVLGNELVTLGDFSASTGWTLGAGASIGSGVLTLADVENGVGASRAPVETIVAGYIYRGQFTIATITQGSASINVGTVTGAPNPKLQLASHNSQGTFVESGVLPDPFNSQGLLLRSTTTPTSGTFDDFSVKRITPPISDTNTWHHIVITFSTAINASNVTIGNLGTSWLNGHIGFPFEFYSDEWVAGQVKQDFYHEKHLFGR